MCVCVCISTSSQFSPFPSLSSFPILCVLCERAIVFFFAFCTFPSFFHLEKQNSTPVREGGGCTRAAHKTAGGQACSSHAVTMGADVSKVEALFNQLDTGLLLSLFPSSSSFPFFTVTTTDHNGKLQLNDLLSLQRVPGIDHPVTRSIMLLFRVCLFFFKTKSHFCSKAVLFHTTTLQHTNSWMRIKTEAYLHKGQCNW